MKDSVKYSFIEWLSSEEMHEATKQWVSEMLFISDEQEFLDDLVKSYTLQLVDSSNFEESKAVVSALAALEKDGNVLMKKIVLHKNQLDIVTDQVDQLKMEKAYIATHKELLISFNEYGLRYRSLKAALFKMISIILKKQKQKRLLN